MQQLRLDSVRDAGATSGGDARAANPMVEGAAATIASSADVVGSESAGGVEGHAPRNREAFAGAGGIGSIASIESGPALSLPAGVRLREGIRADDSPCWIARRGPQVCIAATPEEATRRLLAAL